MACSVPSRQDVASGRPCRRCFVHGLPVGRPLGGVFFWLLFLHEQEKLLARSQRYWQRSLCVKTGEKAHQPFQDGGIVSPVSKVPLRTKHVCHGRVTFFACTKKVTKEMHPDEAALRASRELTCSSQVAPTRHPVAKGLNAPSMALLPGFRRPVHGGFKGGR